MPAGAQTKLHTTGFRESSWPGFTNPEIEEAWKDVRKMFRRACKAAKLTGIWFHDLRRSFVTNARRRGVPESVVKMSGHRILTGVTYRQLDYCLEAGGFTVEVPDLPGVITEADSIVEARRLVREAAALWLDVDTARAKAHAR